LGLRPDGAGPFFHKAGRYKMSEASDKISKLLKDQKVIYVNIINTQDKEIEDWQYDTIENENGINFTITDKDICFKSGTQKIEVFFSGDMVINTNPHKGTPEVMKDVHSLDGAARFINTRNVSTFTTFSESQGTSMAVDYIPQETAL
jgi:hypothetical protein